MSGMAERQLPTSLVQNVINALVEDPQLSRTAAAAAAAAEAPLSDANLQEVADAETADVSARLDADELLKQAEEQAGDQVSFQTAAGCLLLSACVHKVASVLVAEPCLPLLQFQGLLDSKSLKRLVTSFDRKVNFSL